MSKLGDLLGKEVYSNSNASLRGSGGGAPNRRRLWRSGGFAPRHWPTFRNFLEKKAVLTPLDHILHVFRAI